VARSGKGRGTELFGIQLIGAALRVELPDRQGAGQGLGFVFVAEPVKVLEFMGIYHYSNFRPVRLQSRPECAGSRFSVM
jgi:hypothetical protein